MPEFSKSSEIETPLLQLAPEINSKDKKFTTEEI